MLYFAYGSNMLTSRLEDRVGRVSFVGIGRLSGYRLVFNKIGSDGSGKATAIKSVADFVEGVVYDLDDVQFSTLDTYEKNYDRQNITVQAQTERLRAVTYIGQSGFIKNGLKPSDSYLRYVINGANEHKLSRSYIEHIIQTAEEGNKG